MGNFFYDCQKEYIGVSGKPVWQRRTVYELDTYNGAEELELLDYVPSHMLEKADLIDEVKEKEDVIGYYSDYNLHPDDLGVSPLQYTEWVPYSYYELYQNNGYLKSFTEEDRKQYLRSGFLKWHDIFEFFAYSEIKQMKIRYGEFKVKAFELGKDNQYTPLFDVSFTEEFQDCLRRNRRSRLREEELKRQGYKFKKHEESKL